MRKILSYLRNMFWRSWFFGMAFNFKKYTYIRYTFPGTDSGMRLLEIFHHGLIKQGWEKLTDPASTFLNDMYVWYRKERA
jgi:hypothetical protein